MHNYRQQRGAALLTALFITTVAAVIAAAIMLGQRDIIKQVQLTLGSERLYTAIQRVQAWAINSVANYTNQMVLAAGGSGVVPRLKTTFPPMTIGNAVLVGRLRDQQGLFNINSLTAKTAQTAFKRLLLLTDTGINAQQANVLVRNIVAWLSKGSGNQYYLSLKPPRLAGHQAMADISELRAVAGMTSKIYQAIRPYITAYVMATTTAKTGKTGKAAAIDINFAPAVVLASVLGIDSGKAADLVACRKGHGAFVKLANFQVLCINPNFPDKSKAPSLAGLTTQSHHFLAVAQADAGDQQMILTTYLVTQRLKNNTMKVQIAWQALN